MSDAIDWIAALVRPLGEIDPAWALLALVFHLGNLACRSVAWRNVLSAAFPASPLSAYRVGRAYAVGVALNGYLPARGGEAAKVALVRLQHPSTSTAAVASSCSVVLLFDSVVGIALLTVGWRSGVLPSAPPLPGTGGSTAPLLGLVVLVLAVLAWPFVRRALPRVRGLLTQLWQGVAVLRSPGRYARTVVAVQALAWCCRIGVVACMLAAFGISAPLPLAALVVVVGGMSTLVPVPGGAGTQQALAVFVLSGVASTSAALSYSIGMQVGVTLINTTIGAIAAMLVFGRLHPVRALRDAAAAATLRPAVDPVS